MANCLIYSGLYMDFVTHSHRHAIAIVKEPQFKADWESFCNVLKSITDSDIIKYFETPDQRQAKSISEAINHLINGRMIKAGWNAQSHIFGDERFRDKRWTLDFSKPGEAFGKGGFSVEVAFNHGEGTAWNLIKPVLASELNHVAKENQFEPATTRQHAFQVYHTRWPNNGIHSNDDISTVKTESLPSIVHLLVGGFPCQDYSVARTLNQADGLVGKKGVLWWQIHRLLRDKTPPFGLFENVDRLLKSPATQRGRDFAVMLVSLTKLGYVAEWRVINAADYGMPTKRLRVFIMAYRKGTPLAERLLANRAEWLTKSGVIAKAFPVEKPLLIPESSFVIKEDSLDDISDNFNTKNPDSSPFANTGLICGRDVLTIKTTPLYDGPRITLRDILLPDKQVDANYIIPENEVKKWRYCKGAKHLTRTKKNGIVYSYDEGPMSFPDPLNRPARTIITAEGGATPSRFKHVVQMSDGRYRRLMPVELERINTFPDNHTKLGDITDTKRAFFMGNALVTEVVTRLGLSLAKAIEAS